MPFKLAPLILVAVFLPTLPLAAMPTQGNIVTVTGQAHIERGGQGTYILIQNPGGGPDVSGFIAFGNHRAYPGWAALEGRRVAISGVLAWNGRAMINMTDPDQLTIVD